MSVVSTYYLSVHTGIDCTPDTYTQEAGKLTTLLADILNDTAQLAAFTHNATLATLESEVEVILEGEPRELVAKAVVDVTAESKVRFDKGKFTTAVKAGADSAWSVRVYKKQE